MMIFPSDCRIELPVAVTIIIVFDRILQTIFRVSTVQIPGISQLLPSLYLCGASVISGKALEHLAISFVINIAPELPDTPLPHSNFNCRVLYLRINAFDLPNANLSVHFDEVTDMIETVRQTGGRTLVHCVAGVSRSTTFCLAYLIKYAGMNLREAFFHTKAIRPQIRPNLGFFQQLRAYEQHLHGVVSINMVYYECIRCKIPDVYETEYRAMEDFYQKQKKFKRLHRY
uniref:Protein-tyrosine-phosphatase n=1 Tax=Glossina palpalis gambiensis TaxID=67801 RepID=A0A1B0BRR4_9MUSC